MIYINCFDLSEVTIEQYDKCYRIVSEERRKRADRYQTLESSKVCIFSEVLLRYSFFQIYGKSIELHIECNTYGKPYIKNEKEFFFNISHSGKWIVMAFGSHEVGVDIEQIRWNSSLERVTSMFFTKEEREYIFCDTNQSDIAKRFTKIWTLKECYMKFLGKGFSKGFLSFSVDGKNEKVKDDLEEQIIIKSNILGNDYILSVCSKEESASINKITMETIGEFVDVNISADKK